MDGTPGFVGRHAELRQLAGCLREATGGHGRLVTIVGEPGIGKTRTIEELVARSPLSDAQVLWGRCPEHEGAPAYWPWSQIARAWLERHDVDTIRAVLGADGGRLAQIVPAVREHLPDVEVPADADPNQARFHLFDAVTRFLVHAARRESMLVVLDDLHWADPASLQLLGFLARELRGAPLLLVTLAETVARLGDAERAAILYPKLLPFADRCVVVSLWASAWMGSVQRYLGLLAATMGRTDDAVAHLEAALAVHERMGARPLAAHTQADLARALDAVDPARAASLRAAARATAERHGMTRLRERLGASASAPSDVAAIEASLQREGDYWTLRFGGRDVRLKDTKGLHYLATLLRHAGRELHALDIAGGSEAAPDATPIDDRGDAGELLDPAARAAYARRIDALGDELEDARRFDDAERATRAEREIEFLERELSRGVGLGGRVRRAASASERARLNITRAIGRVVEKIAASDATLGQHLQATVHTGTFCVYAPDPRVPVRWDV